MVRISTAPARPLAAAAVTFEQGQPEHLLKFGAHTPASEGLAALAQALKDKAGEAWPGDGARVGLIGTSRYGDISTLARVTADFQREGAYGIDPILFSKANLFFPLYAMGKPHGFTGPASALFTSDSGSCEALYYGLHLLERGLATHVIAFEYEETSGRDGGPVGGEARALLLGPGGTGPELARCRLGGHLSRGAGRAGSLVLALRQARAGDKPGLSDDLAVALCAEDRGALAEVGLADAPPILPWDGRLTPDLFDALSGPIRRLMLVPPGAGHPLLLERAPEIVPETGLQTVSETVTAPASARDSARDPIVVTGIGLNAPFGGSLDDLAAVLSGRRAHAVGDLSERLDLGGGKVSRAFPHWEDRSITALFDAAVETQRAALADAGIDLAVPMDGPRVGLSVGSISGMDFERIGADDAGDGVNALGRHCHGRLGLTGPLVHATSACTSGAVALYWARAVLENGDADVMLAGGADRIRPTDFAGFGILRAIDPEGTRPFHPERRGITMGEGACFLVLERLSHARSRGARVLAEFSGGGLSCDAHHATAPKPEGLAEAIGAALSATGLAPSDIRYVNCHGTGTPANDGAEITALSQVFGDQERPPVVGSTKGFLGHWLGTAAALEAAVLLLVLRDQWAPGMPWLPAGAETLGPFSPGPEGASVPFDHVMSNSLGFGGGNVSLIFSRAPAAGLQQEEKAMNDG